MIEYLTVKRDVKVVNIVTCDKCKKKITDDMEEQEMHHIDFVGGYASVFGDCSHIRCDLCQSCLFEMIKDIYYIDKDDQFY